MKKLLNLPYFIYSITIFIVWMPFVILFHLLVKVAKTDIRRLLLIQKMHRLWIGSFEFLTGMRFQLLSWESVDTSESYVFVVNHNNMLDVAIAGSIFPHPIKFLVKKELTKIPLLGWIIQNISIAVDRSSKESRRQSLVRMTNQLQSGISILVFPEGTRNQTDSPLKSFHPGAFSIAIAAQRPIIPVVINNSRSMQPAGTSNFYPGRAQVRVLPPVPTEGMTERDIRTLTKKVYGIMEAAFVEGENVPVGQVQLEG
ncbi:MAG: lysophospholipid acyltransferase family protein [Bacteroidota bacterium]